VSLNNQNLDQTARTASLVGQIGCVTGFASIVIIGLAFAVGRFLDSLLETSGIFTILFLLGSFPITLYVIVRISLWALARAQKSLAGDSESNNEDMTTTEDKTTTED
jgi:F0F1-type ATP synthase assembly protein I